MKLLFLLLASNLTFADPTENRLSDLLSDDTGELAAVAQQLLGKNGGDRFFYYPSAISPYDPGEFGYKFQDVSFKSEDGTKLHAWFLPAGNTKKPKGTIVFSHGNAGALGHHLGFATFFVQNGYNLFTYDYRGYGKSEGTITRAGLIQDVHAAFAAAKKQPGVDPTRLISYGHSLGGAKSITAIGQKKIPGLRAVIVYAGFYSYKDMAFQIGGKLGGDLVSDEFSPRDFVEKISPTPLLIVHGTEDGVVPLSQGELLYKKARQPKTLMKVKDGGHQNALSRNDQEYYKKILTWLDQTL